MEVSINPFLTAAEQFEESPKLHILLYGETGSGKTTWAARAPRPLILSLEHQGMASVYAANPDAIVVNVPDRNAFLDLWAAVLDATECTIDGQPAIEVSYKGHKIKVQSIILDSFTELTYLFQSHWEVTMPSESHSQRRWGKIREDGLRTLKSLTRAKVGVVMLCRAQYVIEDGRRIASPIVSPKSLVNDIGGYFNIVARAGRTSSKGIESYYITTAGESGVAGKSHADLPRRWWNTTEAGRTTYGSLMLHMFGDKAPHADGDSAHWVTAGKPDSDGSTGDEFSADSGEQGDSSDLGF